MLPHNLVPDPLAGSDEVVVDVSVADTLHLDTVLRQGAFPFPVVEPPYVPGGGVAGVVVSVGTDVNPEWVGRRVAARTGVGRPTATVETIAAIARRDKHSGGYSERAVVPETGVVPIPDEVSLPDAAALINDGMTAMLLIESARIQPGEWVLITPAGRGLGSLLVQLVHAAGGQVFGAARGEQKLTLARELGADATADYADDAWTEQARAATAGLGFDVVMDGIGGRLGRTSFGLTRPGGRFFGYGAPSGDFTQITAAEADRRSARVVSLLELEMAAEDQTRLPRLAFTETAAGRLRPIIGQTFPLEWAADAQAAIEGRAVIGKTLLLTDR